MPKGNEQTYTHRNMNYPMTPATNCYKYNGVNGLSYFIIRELKSITFGETGRHVACQMVRCDKPEYVEPHFCDSLWECDTTISAPQPAAPQKEEQGYFVTIDNYPEYDMLAVNTNSVLTRLLKMVPAVICLIVFYYFALDWLEDYNIRLSNELAYKLQYELMWYARFATWTSHFIAVSSSIALACCIYFPLSYLNKVWYSCFCAACWTVVIVWGIYIPFC